MVLARMTLSLLLMALILPWGAYVNAASARTAAVETEVMRNAQARPLDFATPMAAAEAESLATSRSRLDAPRLSPQPPRIVVSWLKCRKVHLPGSVCGPHMVLPGEVDIPQPGNRFDTVAICATLNVVQMALAPPRSPPRLV